MHSGHNASAGAHGSPYDAVEDDELSIGSEQWARDGAAVRGAPTAQAGGDRGPPPVQQAD